MILQFRGKAALDRFTASVGEELGYTVSPNIYSEYRTPERDN